MILNAFSILEIFIGVLSVILMFWAGVLSLKLAFAWQVASTAEERVDVERRSHLVLLVAVVLLGIRLLNCPLFYATLQSFVPDIDGAMCIFGVTQVKRALTGIAEILKPVSFFLVGAWFVLHHLDQKTETSPLMGRKLLFLGFTSVVVVVESVLDVMLMFKISPGTLVSCCTTVTDILERPTRLVPKAVLGARYENFLGYGFYVSHVLLMVALGVRVSRMGGPSRPKPQRQVTGILFLHALLNAALFLLAQIEVHAPKIMGLPFHHCLYCLWQYVPDTILMYLLFALGTSAIGWVFVLELFGRTKETTAALPRLMRALYGFSLFCLAASLMMNTVHLLAA
jgi:hypothetical protein